MMREQGVVGDVDAQREIGDLLANGDTAMAIDSIVEGLRLILPAFEAQPIAFIRLVFALSHDLARACESADIAIPADLAPFVEQINDLAE